MLIGLGVRVLHVGFRETTYPKQWRTRWKRRRNMKWKLLLYRGCIRLILMVPHDPKYFIPSGLWVYNTPSSCRALVSAVLHRGDLGNIERYIKGSYSCDVGVV